MNLRLNKSHTFNMLYMIFYVIAGTHLYKIVLIPFLWLDHVDFWSSFLFLPNDLFMLSTLSKTGIWYKQSPFGTQGLETKTHLENTFTLNTLTSVCIISILFSIHFLWCWQGEFVQWSRASLVGDHFLYSCDLNVSVSGDVVRRK